MKTQRYFTFLFIALFTLLISGCVTDDDDVEPGDPRDKFLGNWTVSESCIRLTYEVEIVYDPMNSSQVLIYNFGNPGPGYDPAVALVVSNKIYVANQVIGENWTVNGEGTLTDDEILWDYELKLSGSLLQCTATYYK